MWPVRVGYHSLSHGAPPYVPVLRGTADGLYGCKDLPLSTVLYYIAQHLKYDTDGRAVPVKLNELRERYSYMPSARLSRGSSTNHILKIRDLDKSFECNTPRTRHNSFVVARKRLNQIWKFKNVGRSESLRLSHGSFPVNSYVSKHMSTHMSTHMPPHIPPHISIRIFSGPKPFQP